MLLYIIIIHSCLAKFVGLHLSRLNKSVEAHGLYKESIILSITADPFHFVASIVDRMQMDETLVSLLLLPSRSSR